jgi:uncharacterized protein
MVITKHDQKVLLKKVRWAAERRHTGSKGSHDWEHTLRVYALALYIARKEKADIFIVSLAALLHDIARHREDRARGRLCHAREGARLAEQLLRRDKVDEDFIARVGHCIATHRFRGTLRPLSLEAKVLFDADKLDSIGAVGIGRAFLFAGEVGARLHNPEVDIGKTSPYTREDTAHREFMVKLRRIKKRMLTREGRRLARERHEFMKRFFERLGQEVRGER